MTEQKKGSHKYFVDLGNKLEVVTSRTAYIDEVRVNTTLIVSFWFTLSVTLAGKGCGG